MDPLEYLLPMGSLFVYLELVNSIKYCYPRFLISLVMIRGLSGKGAPPWAVVVVVTYQYTQVEV